MIPQFLNEQFHGSPALPVEPTELEIRRDQQLMRVLELSFELEKQEQIKVNLCKSLE